MSFTPVPDYVVAALARLISQYQQKPNIAGLLGALVSPLNDLELAATQLNTLRQLLTATGQNLDNIGKILGLARFPGDSDSIYRNKLIAQVKINTSQGQPEFAIQTFQLFTMALQVLLFEFFPGSIIMESDYIPPDQATVDLLLNILNEVLPAGVRPYGIVSFDPVSSFAYNGPLQGQGYGANGDPSTGGGKYAHLYTRNTFFQYAGVDPTGGGYGSSIDPLVGGRYAPYHL